MSITSKLKEIRDGWYYDAFPNELILQLAEFRANICAECPLNVNNICSSMKSGEVVSDFEYQGEKRLKGEIHKGCGCPLSKKTKSPTSKCPLAKW